MLFLSKNASNVALTNSMSSTAISLAPAKLPQEQLSDIAQSGGEARAKKLTKAQRKEIAQKAAKARWAKKKRS